MSLVEHLREFRKRLVISAIALVLGMVAAIFLTDAVIWAITEPIRAVGAERGEDALVSLMFQTVTSAFDLRMRIAFALGILISAPVWLWQLWAFLMPGLTRKEIHYTIGFVAAAIPLFAGGVYVGWLIMPHIVELMASFTPEGGSNMFTANYYYDFVFKLLLVVGVSFVLPVFLVALNLAGIVSGRAILKGWRTAIIVAALFSGLATPAADIVSMMLLAGILVVLYLAAAGVSMLFDRRRSKREARLLEAPI
ncbi:twin-arginine translocase subunit TatC [Microbacterium sp.]|uniref:twin-arginine translocase subunit TatC n=1 Tax=Microbacterium sp. TaxID=51671 RepID=UPI0039E70358